ncbi:MAG: cytochrome c maturation protein CcmE [Cytophagaceae bacterium]|jgi:cytochrome c-type biogenesis protein CcmE|nr:cytochrome c maturation protein CcmE [Cytophagaceae bacterium]
MKIPQLIGIVVIAVAIGIIISTTGNASTYVNFSAAEAMMKSGDDDKVHVVGHLKKENGQAFMMYNPVIDPNRFEFVLVDLENRPCNVVYRDAKPQDFEKSEQVVVIGTMKGNNVFEASEILMKCPSKYEEKKVDAAMR